MFLKKKNAISGLLVIFLMSTVFLIWGLTGDGFYMAMMVLLFLVIGDYDLRKGIIPDPLVFTGVVIQILKIWIKGGGLEEIGRALGSGVIIAMLVCLIVWIMDRVLQSPTMGGGDIKLIFMLGMMTSIMDGFLALFLSCLIGIIIFSVLGKERKTVIPFGPALCTGWVLVCCIRQCGFRN